MKKQLFFTIALFISPLIIGMEEEGIIGTKKTEKNKESKPTEFSLKELGPYLVKNVLELAINCNLKEIKDAYSSISGSKTKDEQKARKAITGSLFCTYWPSYDKDKKHPYFFNKIEQNKLINKIDNAVYQITGKEFIPHPVIVQKYKLEFPFRPSVAGCIQNEKIDPNSTIIDLSNKGIKSARGIEKFSQLITLNLANNQLTVAPNVSKNSYLTTLNLANNQLTVAPDVSANSFLITLNLANNQLTVAPDVSTNSFLTILNLEHNELTAVPDTNNNPDLKCIFIDDNPFNK